MSPDYNFKDLSTAHLTPEQFQQFQKEYPAVLSLAKRWDAPVGAVRVFPNGQLKYRFDFECYISHEFLCDGSSWMWMSAENVALALRGNQRLRLSSAPPVLLEEITDEHTLE